jgi:hypothetical protein
VIDFKGFDKIARLSRGCTITEKIDGTNAQICIVPISVEQAGHPMLIDVWEENGVGMGMLAGSRTRWITPQDDNYGFARWAFVNAGQLRNLGEGSHFGEWWGCGVQRGYGLKEKRFSLFNTARWNDTNPPPACCGVVPVLYSGVFTSTAVDDALLALRDGGSRAAPGFMRPEGVVVYQSAGRCYFKKTIEKDEEPKSRSTNGGAA